MNYFFRCILGLPLVLAACGAPQKPLPEPPAPGLSIPAPEVSPAPRDASSPIVLAAVGDIMLGGTAEPEMEKFGYDYPFDATRDILLGADVVFGNLEGPLTHGGEPFEKTYVFRSPPGKVAPALARAGFSILSLANNHSLDYSDTGLSETISALDAENIRSIGAGRNIEEARRPAILDIRGTRFAFLAYSNTFPEEFWATPDQAGTAFGHEDQIREDVGAARKNAEVVIVSFHWGREVTTELRPYQIQLGHAAIDAGASAVIGHHPHVLQAVEQYGGGVILYSLGNFAFGSYSENAVRSAIGVLSFETGKLTGLKLIPLNVFNKEVFFQPVPLEGPEADEVIARLQELSRPLGTVLENEDGAAVLRW